MLLALLDLKNQGSQVYFLEQEFQKQDYLFIYFIIKQTVLCRVSRFKFIMTDELLRIASEQEASNQETHSILEAYIT